MYGTRGTGSAICAQLVPWSGMEEESGAIRGHADPDGRHTLPIREGSDGEFSIVAHLVETW
jgi:hypothetical protein